MSKAAMNLQDSFLNQVRRENSEVRVLLVNGTLLRGTVKGFDNFTLILNNRNGQHLIYKHSIAQIVTHRPHGKTDEVHGSEHDETVSADTEKTSEPAETADMPAPKEKQGEGNRDKSAKPRKEGFNKLDLSNVKLGKN